MGKRKIRPGLAYLYDSREQRPYDLAAPDPKLFEDYGFIERTLEAGDIGAELDTVELSLRIERKSHGDFVGCCRHDRGCRAATMGNDAACGARCRFERELSRLAAYQASHVIIEAPVSMIRAGFSRSQMNGLAVWNSIAGWSVAYPTVHFWTLTNRTEGQIWARTLIHLFAKRFLERGAPEE